MKPRSKYGAQPTVVDNIRFHSTRESRRYSELKLLQRAGEINALECQVPYPLSVVSLESGEIVQIGNLVVDFRYWTVKKHPAKRDRLVVEDVKGWKTLPLARWKAKHLKAQYGIDLVEVR